jgi:hypothetical protein
MKKRIPAQVIELCDVCGTKPGCSMDKCVVCGRDYCLICRAIVSGCIHSVDICKDCGKDQVVEDTILQFSPKLVTVVRERDAALRRLRRGVLRRRKEDLELRKRENGR